MIPSLTSKLSRGNGAAAPVVADETKTAVSVREEAGALATIRVASLQELPAWTANITDMRVRGEDGGRTFSDAIRRILAVLTISEHKAIIVLNGDGVQGTDDFRTARSILRQRGFELAGIYVVPPTVFGTLVSPDDFDDTAVKVRDSAQSILQFCNIIEAATIAKASDVHVCIRERSAKVLVRIHGRLVPLEGFSDLQRDDAVQSVAVAYNKLALEDSRDKTQPQFLEKRDLYCMIDRGFRTGRWRIRYQSIRAEGGLDVVMRLLPGEAISKSQTLEDLGYAASQQELMRLGLMRRAGAIFFSGETGAGKSTTIMVAMTMDPERKYMKSYTIEDPVEYRMYGVTQHPVPRDIAAAGGDDGAFTTPMRIILRADPDVIMVGEVRDKMTGDLFIPMVLSGHRALTTIHASSAFGTITRLAAEPIMMPRSVLAQKGFISMLVYQALVPTLCDCARPAAEVLDKEYLERIETRFKVSTGNMRAASDGCEHCKQGRASRTVAAEIVLPTSEMRQLILQGRESEAELVWRRTRKVGFDDPDMTGKTAFEHALYKCLQGEIDPRDIETAFESFETYEIEHIDGYDAP